jgi:flagellar hook-associated protein 1 FlgK
MADLLSTGISGVRTYQRALATVGNNIANVDTEGYSRQRLEIQESSSSSEGSLNIGNGARAVRVQRSYDSFVVENLRSSQSQLTKHQATLEYVTQLENILADKQLSLSTSLDGFFSAVQEVSLSPSSIAARQNMLNAAESTVAQFTSVGTQLSSIEESSYSDLTGQVSALNQFADQLASINVSLNRVNSIDKQPNELLDQRDTLIQDMSKLLRVHAVEKNNGAVDIHIGDVASGQYLVQGNKGSTLGIERSATNPDKAVLMLDPFMSPQAVTQVVGGSIAGISEFRQNSLTILRDELDTLTQVFVGQVNDTHALGIDAQGNFGGDLFSVGNIYAVTPGLNKGTGFVTVSALPNAKIERLTMDLTYSDSKKLWTLTDTVSKKAVTGVTELTMGGVKVTLSGVPKDADTFSLTSTKRPIDAMQVSVTKHSNIASGGAVSVTRASANASGTRMILNGYVKPTAAVADTTMDTALRNNIAQVAASDLTASNSVAFVIPANTQDSQFYSTEQNGSSNTQMQVFTRAGKQLYGSALSSSEQTALVTSSNGFSSNAAYDSTYNNQTGSNAYMDANVTVTNPTSGDARDYFALAGSLKEDLLVFVTGTGSAEVSGQWGSLATVDVREQLRQNIDVQFAADASTYVLTDTTTNTKLTSGTFAAGGTIEHNGWTVSFDGVIQANDKFSVRGNSSQAGDNRNLLKIIDLQGNKDIFSGRGDFTEVYTDVIGDLGYSVVQSAVSRDAQQIIFDQAQAKRDETSAVSLDEEAANLLRFQQAYQASAQVISTATKLFDTILGIR